MVKKKDYEGITLLRDGILIEFPEVKDTTDSGIVIPESLAQDRARDKKWTKVLSVGVDIEQVAVGDELYLGGLKLYQVPIGDSLFGLCYEKEIPFIRKK